MKNTVFFVLAAFITLPTIVISQSTTDISGNWELITETSKSKQTQTLIITKNGDHFVANTGKIEFRVDVEGDQITWNIRKSSAQKSLDITSVGKKTPNGGYQGYTSAKTKLLEIQRMRWTMRPLE